MVLAWPARSGECASTEYSGIALVMQQSVHLDLVFPRHVPGRGRSNSPISERGFMTPISPFSRATRAAAGREMGAVKGFAWHHASATLASRSVALFVSLCSKARDGGGGRRDVSGTADCQSWWGCCDGGGPGGGAYSECDGGGPGGGAYVECDGGGPTGGAYWERNGGGPGGGA